MPLQIPPEARDAAPGVLGALVAIPWTQGPLLMRASMFLGGASLSYLGSDAFAQVMGMTSGRGFAGFVLGLFGMSVAAKIYEAIAAVAAGELWGAVIEWLRTRLGLPAKREG